MRRTSSHKSTQQPNDPATSPKTLDISMTCDGVFKLRYFSGLTAEQASLALGISTRTVHRHWAYAKAWLFRHLRDD